MTNLWLYLDPCLKSEILAHAVEYGWLRREDVEMDVKPREKRKGNKRGGKK